MKKFFIIIFFSLPTLVISQDYNLCGLWWSDDYNCPGGVNVPFELFFISQDDNGYVIATKIIGDDCVFTGDITFEGQYGNNNPFDITFTTGGNGPPYSYINSSITIINESHIQEQGINIDYYKASCDEIAQYQAQYNLDLSEYLNECCECTELLSNNNCDPITCEELDLLSFNDANICGQAISLAAIAGLDNYSWSTGSDNQFTSISLPGTYTVSSSYTTDNFVTNGNFSQGNTNFSSSYTYSSSNLNPEGYYSVTTNANYVHSGFTGTGNGNYMVVNGSTSPGMEVWCQDINIEPETTYNFSSLVTTVANGNPALLQLSIDGGTIGTQFSAPNSTGIWSEFNAEWSSNNETTIEICIVNQNIFGSGNDFGIDDISFSTICTSSESITVTEIDPANATIFNVDDLCESGAIVNLNAIDPGGTWTGNGISNASTGAFNPNLAGPGIHNISYTIDGDCGDQNSIEVSVVEETESSITAPESICENESPIDLEGIPGIGTWQGNGLINTSTGLFNPASAQIGNNTISYTPDGFCMEVSTHTIEVHEIIVPETDLFHEICYGDLANLNTGDMTFSEYNWSTNENLSNINVFNDGNYIVTLTDFNDCIQEVEFEVLDKDNCEVIVMPNVFTPNGDYENDLFIPITYDYIPNSVLKIYNRWGVQVYYSQSIEKGWNGKHFSEECAEGVYFWVVEFQTNTGNHKSVSGSVNLLR